MEKIINFTKKIIKVFIATLIITLWFMSMCYMIQHTIFNY